MSLGDFYQYFFYAIWLLFIIVWLVLSRNVKVTVRRQAALPRLLNLALLYGAAALLASPFIPVQWLTLRVLPGSQWKLWCGLGAALTSLGVLYSIWARMYLGRNWSSVAAVKADHELVTAGPYRWTRHPIYSGLLLAFVGTALATGQWRGVLAVASALIAIAQRIIVEERFMRQQFGELYRTYAHRVRALVPGLI
jgi:protein-S-isoprenylcysteine O-methyltransferase Ste14